MTEGFTRDQEQVIVEIPSKLSLPESGNISVSVISFESVDTFYVHVMKDEAGTLAGKIDATMEFTLSDLLFDMNRPEQIKGYEPLGSMPNVNELVIAPYTDGRFYRAKVLEPSETVCTVSFNLENFK